MTTVHEHQHTNQKKKLALFKYCEKKCAIDILKDVDINYSLQSELFERNEAGYTFLHFAAMKGDSDSVEYLLNLNADFTRQGFHDGCTPLHGAIKNCSGDWKSRMKLISNDHSAQKQVANQLLFAQVKSGNTFNPCNKNGISHMHLACLVNNVEAVKFFLNAGVSVGQPVNIDSGTVPGFTPLHFAISWNCVETVELLLKHGADFNVKDAKGMSSFHMLIQNHMNITDVVKTRRRFECTQLKKEVTFINKMIELILTEGELNDPIRFNEFGLSLLHIAAMLQDTHIVENILKKLPNMNAAVKMESAFWPGYTPLHFAAHFNIETMKLLMRNGANIFVIDAENQGPLDLCLTRYEPLEIHSVLSILVESESILLSDGSTKLLDMIAAMQNLDSLNNFLQNLQDVNAFIPSNSPLWPGYTLLHLAVTMVKNRNFCMNIIESKWGLELDTQLFDDDNAESYNCSDEDMEIYLKRIKLCLEKGCKATVPDASGSTPIHLAFDFSEEEVVRLLLESSENNMRSNQTNCNNLSLLHIACVVNNIQIIEVLLHNGADVNIPALKSFEWVGQIWVPNRVNLVRVRANSTPLHLVVIFSLDPTMETVELLLENGADIYAKDSLSFTPIHLAMSTPLKYMNKRKAVKLLSTDNLKESRTDEGVSHLHVAAYSNDAEAIRKLMRSEDVDVNSIIESCVTENRSNRAKDFSIFADFAGMTPLHVAIKNDSTKSVKVLLAKNANIFVRDRDGLSPLHHSFNSKFIGGDCILEHFARVLMTQDLGTGPIDDSGLTMLHIACKLFDEKWAQDLLKRGADVNAQIKKNNRNPWSEYTPLHTLMSNAQNNQSPPSNYIGMIRLLLKYGADVTLSKNYTPILACSDMNSYSGKEIHFLRSRHAEDWKEACKLLLKSQKSYDINPTSKLRSHLHFACAINAVKIVEKFLDNGIDINCLPSTFPYHPHGIQTPLLSAIIHGSEEAARLLIKRGADVMCKDIEGATILHYAVQATLTRISVDFMQLLLSYGVDINAKTRSNQTAWDSLLSSLENEMNVDRIKFFLQNGAKINFLNASMSSGILGLSMNLPSEDRQWIFNSVLEAQNTSELDERGCNAIHSLVLDGRRNTLSLEDCIALLEKLIQGGCNLNQRNIEGLTPLHLAMSRKATTSIKALIYEGADLNLADVESFSQRIHSQEYPLIYREWFDGTSKMIIVGLNLHKKTKETRKMLLSQNRVEIDEKLDNRCEQELEKMKNMIISRFLTMRHFLYELGAVVEYSLLPKAIRLVIDEFFNPVGKIHEIFPEFGSLLLCQYRKAVARVELINPAIDALVSSGIHLPDLCLHEILKFLKNEELAVLIET